MPPMKRLPPKSAAKKAPDPKAKKNPLPQKPTKPKAPPPATGLTATRMMNATTESSQEGAEAVRVKIARVKYNKEVNPDLLEFITQTMPRDDRTGAVQPHTTRVKRTEPKKPFSVSKLQVFCDCVIGSTKILTKEGIKTALELVSDKDENHVDFPYDVTYIVRGVEHQGSRFWSKGLRQTFKVVLENEMTITTTLEHEFSVLDAPTLDTSFNEQPSFSTSLKALKDIVPGDLVELEPESSSEFIHVSKILSVEDAGMQEVFSCHVPNINLFVGNGIIVKNCERFLFFSAYALRMRGASLIKLDNGQPPLKTNPTQAPGLCRHGYKVMEYIQGRGI